MRVSECEENQEQRIFEKERCPLDSGEVELLGALFREPTLVLLIDNSDVFWFMGQKDLTYLTTANTVITLFANPGIWRIPNIEHVCKIYMGRSEKEVVDSAIQTLEQILEERK